MLPSNGDTRIPHGVLPYVSSLCRQRLEERTVWGWLHRLSVNCGSIPGRATGLSLLQSVRTGSGSHAWVPETLSARVNRSGHAAYRSPQSTAGFVSPLPVCFHDVYGDMFFFAFLIFLVRDTYSAPFSFSVIFSRSW